MRQASPPSVYRHIAAAYRHLQEGLETSAHRSRIDRPTTCTYKRRRSSRPPPCHDAPSNTAENRSKHAIVICIVFGDCHLGLRPTLSGPKPGFDQVGGILAWKESNALTTRHFVSWFFVRSNASTFLWSRAPLSSPRRSHDQPLGEQCFDTPVSTDKIRYGSTLFPA